MRFFRIALVAALFTVKMSYAQDSATVVSANRFDKISDILSLAKMPGWIFRPGNDPKWAQPVIDTTGWIKMQPIGLSKKFADRNGRVEGWFRINVKFDSSLWNKILWIDNISYSASEIYMDGRLIAKTGNMGGNGKPFEEYNNDIDPLPIRFNSDSLHHFAFHFVGFIAPFPPNELKSDLSEFFTIVGPNPYINLLKYRILVNSAFDIWVAVCGALSLLFWLLTFQNRQEKNLVWIAICTSIYTLFIFFVLKENAIGAHFLSSYIYQLAAYFSMYLLLFLSIPILLIRIFKRTPSRKILILLVSLFLLNSLRPFLDLAFMTAQVILIGTVLFALAICLYYLISSWKNLKGAQWAIVAGLSFSLVTIFTSIIYTLLAKEVSLYLSILFISCFVLSFPVSLLVYVSIRFKEIINEVRINAENVVRLSKEKRLQAENQQKILQEEVNRQTAELRKSLEHLQATQAQLIQSEKMASLGELTAGIAHEIQNPLNFVNNFSDLNKELIDELEAERKKPNEERDEKTENQILNDLKANEEKILHHGKRADAIVRGMLQHARPAAGSKEPTDINGLAEEYFRLSYQGLRAKDKNFNAFLKTDFDKTIGEVNMVSQDIGRALLNFYHNAFYAVRERQKTDSPGYEPTVSVGTKKIDDKILLTIADNGIGIPKNIIDKIFQPFFTTKPTGSGTGLGLSLSYDIIKAHNGEINVASIENEGTEFFIYLPG